MSSTHSDVIFKHQPPSIDHPGYHDWAERLFQEGYDNPYDAYVKPPTAISLSDEQMGVGVAVVAGAAVATGLITSGTTAEKVTAGVTVGLIGAALLYFFKG